MTSKEISNLLNSVIEVIEKYRITDFIVSGLSAGLGVYLNWPIATAMMFGVFVWTWLNPVKSELIIKGTILAISGTGLLILTGRSDRAETMAAFAYYLLVIAIIAIIREHRAENVA